MNPRSLRSIRRNIVLDVVIIAGGILCIGIYVGRSNWDTLGITSAAVAIVAGVIKLLDHLRSL